MPDIHHPATLTLALAAAVCVGMAKTGFGGLGIVSVLLFAQLFPAKASTGALLPLMIFGDVLGVSVYRRHASWPELGRLLPATFAGVICGWWVMPHIPDGQFGRFLGWFILGLMMLTILQRRFPAVLLKASDHPLLGLLSGWSTGVATMLANAAGAITAFYFLARRMDKLTFVGTAAWFFLIVNLSKVPFSVQLGLMTVDSLRFDIFLLPAVAAGGAAGRLLLHHIPQRMFEWITIGMAAAAAVRLIIAS